VADGVTRAVTSFAAALCLAGSLAAPVRAIEIETIEVRYENGLYKVQFAAELHAQPDAVARVLTNYASYPSLDARIEESHLVATPPGAPQRLYTKLRGCLNRVFCRSMIRIETLKVGGGELLATALPDLSDVKSSVTRTVWQASAKGTHVTYTLALDPKFWVPAWYARRAMIDTMRTGTVAMFTSVERVAQELPVSAAGK